MEGMTSFINVKFRCRNAPLINRAASLTHECGRLAMKKTEVLYSNDMALKRMDNVGIVVEDLDAAIAFFTELGMDLEGNILSSEGWCRGRLRFDTRIQEVVGERISEPGSGARILPG